MLSPEPHFSPAFGVAANRRLRRGRLPLPRLAARVRVRDRRKPFAAVFFSRRLARRPCSLTLFSLAPSPLSRYPSGRARQARVVLRKAPGFKSTEHHEDVMPKTLTLQKVAYIPKEQAEFSAPVSVNVLYGKMAKNFFTFQF